MSLQHCVKTTSGSQNIKHNNGIFYILTKNINDSGSVQNINPKIKIIP